MVTLSIFQRQGKPSNFTCHGKMAAYQKKGEGKFLELIVRGSWEVSNQRVTLTSKKMMFKHSL